MTSCSSHRASSSTMIDLDCSLIRRRHVIDLRSIYQTCGHRRLNLAFSVYETLWESSNRAQALIHLQITPPSVAGDQCLVYGVPTPTGYADQGELS